MKQFIFYSIKKSFNIILKKEMLCVFLELITRGYDDEFYKKQIKHLINKIDKEEMERNIINEFSSLTNFSINSDGEFIIKHNFFDSKESLKIYDNYIELKCLNNNSKFLNFLSLHYHDLLVLNINEKEIIPLRLVKPLEIS